MSSSKKANDSLIQYRHRWINPGHFLDREISWLEFNRRVLQQAIDPRTPLLERPRFCEIYRSNLDEFCMKRLGPLSNARDNSLPYYSIDGKAAESKFDEIKAKIVELNGQLQQCFEGDILPQLRSEGIELIGHAELDQREKKFLKQHFHENIYPVLTPLTVDLGHPFPFLSGLSTSLAISFRHPKREEMAFARVKIPENLPQWIPTGENSKRPWRFIHLVGLITAHLDQIFKGMKIHRCLLFRITRNAEYDIHEQDHEDFMDVIEEGIRERKFAPAVRLEYGPDPDPWLLHFITEELNIHTSNQFEMASLANYTTFKEITSLPLEQLKYPPYKSVIPQDFRHIKDAPPSIFSLMRQQDLLAHHPYESFECSVEEFIRQAGSDEQVMAIKISLYRTDSAGRLIDYLIRAAENGKQVVVVIELKARFDEKRNIHWAQKLENVGIHVTYGMVRKKTHSKLAMVIRRDSDQRIRTYAHIGTGNYNPQTSTTYEDLGLFTSHPDICSEAIEVFNHLTGQSLNKEYRELLVAPFNMKKKLLQMIGREIKHSKKGGPAHIVAKMNQLEDTEVIEKLYQASQSGVTIELIVRGFCCLRPGVKGLSENIRVISIVGRYLEHSRIFYFADGKQKWEDGRYYIGSGDWMHRNLHNRVEVAAPIHEKRHRKRLAKVLSTLLNDPRHAWELDRHGHYTQKNPRRNDLEGSHAQLEDFYKKNEETDKGR